MNGEYVGLWHVNAKGEHELHYDRAWLESPRGRPISLSMPLRPAAPYKGEVVRNYFENLLPDNASIRRRIARRFGTTTDAIDLLREIGRDCVGAIQLLPEGSEPENVRRIQATPVSDKEIAEHLARVPAAERFRADEEDDFRISIAGNQEKTAFMMHEGRWCKPQASTPSTHIFKLPLGVTPRGLDLTTSIENEWLCMQLLSAFSVRTANVEMLQFGKQKILCIERFDRVYSSDGWWIRLPQEDFAQVAGVHPEAKYEEQGGPGIRWILDQLLGSVKSDEDRRDFFRTQVLFWMLAGIDGHAKNFSVFIQERGDFRLTPRYDVLSAYPVMGKKAGKLQLQKAKMAMAVWGKNRHYKWAEIRREHFEKTASDCKVANAAQIIDELVDRTPGAISDVEKALPETFPGAVAEPIFTGLREAAQSLRRGHTLATALTRSRNQNVT
jgi:serine/threonine-protein kinase HipA